MKTFKTAVFIATSLTFIMSCGKIANTPSIDPSNSLIESLKLGSMKDWITPENFVDEVTNIYFPLAEGDTFYYFTVLVEDGDTTFEENYVTTTSDVKVILGISCKVIHDAVFSDGILVEDTYDWYAQDIKGNVWYFGEDTKTLLQEDSTWSTEGSFEAGVDGATAGIIMPFDPEKFLGKTFRQEHYVGQAEDYATYVSTNETVTIGLGTYINCLKTEEVTPLEPGVISIKWYAPGIGNIKSSTDIGEDEHGELVGMN